MKATIKSYGHSLIIALCFIIPMRIVYGQGYGDWDWRALISACFLMLGAFMIARSVERQNRVVVVTRYADETDFEVEKELVALDWPKATVDQLVQDLRRSGYGFWRRRPRG